MDLTPDGPLGERDKDMNTLPAENVSTTHHSPHQPPFFFCTSAFREKENPEEITIPPSTLNLERLDLET